MGSCAEFSAGTGLGGGGVYSRCSGSRSLKMEKKARTCTLLRFGTTNARKRAFSIVLLKACNVRHHDPCFLWRASFRCRNNPLRFPTSGVYR